MGIQHECRKKIIEIFNEKPSCLQKTVSKVILKQYKDSLSIERKRGSKRKNEFADQNKTSKVIRTFLKHPKLNTLLEEKWIKNLDFVKIH